MSSRRFFVCQAAVAFLASGLIVNPLPGLAAAQDLSTVEGRAAYMIEQFREHPIRPNAKHGGAPALARLALNPNDAYALDRITHFYDGNPPHGDSRMFSGPGIAWALGKYWGNFTPAQRDHLKANVKEFNDLLGAGTENHALMRNVTAYLYGQYWPNEPGFLGGRMTGAEMKAKASEHLLASLGRLYDMNYNEHLSARYVPVHLYACLTLYECATDPRMKAAADAALHFYFANFAANQFEGKVIPPANRDQGGANPWWLYWADAINTPAPGNTTEHSTVLYAAVSSWRPPAAILSLARGQTAPYELTAAACGHPHAHPNQSMKIMTPAGSVRYVYRDKLYAMGSGFMQYNLEYQAYWNHTTFRAIYKSSERFNFIECYHPYWRSNDRTWEGLNSPFEQWAQHNGTAIVLFNIPDADPWPDGKGAGGRPSSEKQVLFRDARNKHFNNLIKEGLVRYPKSIDQKTETDGWIFLREGDVYIAIRPLKDYTIDTNYRPAGSDFNVIRSAFAQTGFVFDIATKEEFETFEAFQTAVKQNPLVVDWDQLSVKYKSVKGDTLTATWNLPDYRPPQGRVMVRPDITVNGAAVPIDSDFLNGTAVMKSPSVELVDRVLRLRTPAGGLEVDWRGKVPTFSNQ